MDVFRSFGLYVGSVAITQYTGEAAADEFRHHLDSLGVPSYILHKIDGYPSNIEHIVSDEGFGKNDYIKTSRPLVVVTAPGPGSGKMATCLSQLYHEHKRGVSADMPSLRLSRYGISHSSTRSISLTKPLRLT